MAEPHWAWALGALSLLLSFEASARDTVPPRPPPAQGPSSTHKPSSLEEATLLDAIAEGQGRAPAGPPPSRARGRFGFALGVAGTHGGFSIGQLQGNFDVSAEWSGSLSYLWAASAIFDLRVGVNGSYLRSPWELSYRTPWELDAYYDFSLFSVGAELVPRVHFTRSSHYFFGMGPRAAFRHFNAAVYTRAPGTPSGEIESKRVASDLLVQALFELGVAIGTERHVEVTIRIAAGGATSALTARSYGVTLGYMF